MATIVSAATHSKAGQTVPEAGQPTLALVTSTAQRGGLPAGIITLPIAQSPGLVAPAGVALVPTEDVLLLSVALPAMPAAQRRAAVGFAIEDRIAQSLDDVHVALGQQRSPGVWLVAVTARSVLSDAINMAHWPDVMLVPVPRAGWAVWVGSGRAVVRLPDGTGFATASDTLRAFWTAAGSPAVTLYGGTLPAGVPSTAQADLPVTPDPAIAGFDLRAGRQGAGKGQLWPKGAGALLAVLLMAAFAHLGVIVADVIALTRMANERQVSLRTELQLPVDADLDAALTQALSARQTDATRGVLDLLTRAFAAIGDQAGRVFLQEFRYVASDNSAVLSIDAPDLATLQAVETALNAAGLKVTAGAATSSDGAAQVQMTLQGDDG